MKLWELIERAHARLARVQIECLPYETIIERFDRPTTLFYLDPPYWKKDLYKFNFTEDDFIRFEERLRKVSGKFVLSLNDVPQVRALFSRFHIREIELAYTAQSKAGKRYREVIITNFAPKPLS
jgi:DNA adenine methylase